MARRRMAGWALMAPGNLLALRAQEGIAVNWQGTLERVGAAALAAAFSAGVGMLLAFGPRALASRILGEGLGAWRFLSGLWLARWVRLSLAFAGPVTEPAGHCFDNALRETFCASLE